MERRMVVCLFALMTVAMLASVVMASDTTGASAAMDQVGQSSSSWAARILLIGFIATIAWKALESRMFGIAGLVAIPITFIIIGALLLAGPTLLGPFMASGATLR